MQTNKGNPKKDQEQTPKTPKGRVHINEGRCKGCSYCVHFCPTRCLILSGRLNDKGYNLPEMAYPEKCTGCNMCGLYCPDFAIFGERIKNKDEGSKK